MKNHRMAIESDSGVWKPEGFGVSTTDAIFERVAAFAPLLTPIGADKIQKGGGGADISPMRRDNVPLAGLNTDTSRYFHIHHTLADTFDKIVPQEFAQCVAAMAVFAYAVAEQGTG
jgi:carboxypeptidase Q